MTPRAPASKGNDQRLLDSLAEVLASALDEAAMLSAVARLVVPRLGADSARLYQQAQQASRARDDTLAAISHDLRNGLNTVLTAVGLLLRSLPPDSEGRRDRRHVDAIRRSAERMNRVIGDLLDVASIESGRLFVEPQKYAVRPIVEEACSTASGRRRRRPGWDPASA